MRTRHVGAAILSAIALSSCGGASEPADERASERAESAPRETVFDPLVGTMDRARGVQQNVDQRAADLRRAIEESEQ